MCSSPIEVENGYVAFVSLAGGPLWASGTDIYYQCFKYYGLVDSNTLTCTGTSWTGTTPKCEYHQKTEIVFWLVLVLFILLLLLLLALLIFLCCYFCRCCKRCCKERRKSDDDHEERRCSKTKRNRSWADDKRNNHGDSSRSGSDADNTGTSTNANYNKVRSSSPQRSRSSTPKRENQVSNGCCARCCGSREKNESNKRHSVNTGLSSRDQSRLSKRNSSPDKETRQYNPQHEEIQQFETNVKCKDAKPAEPKSQKEVPRVVEHAPVVYHGYSQHTDSEVEEELEGPREQDQLQPELKFQKQLEDERNNELQRQQYEEEEKANEIQRQQKEEEEMENELQRQQNEQEEMEKELQRQQKEEEERANELQRQQIEEEERADELQRHQKEEEERADELQRQHKEEEERANEHQHQQNEEEERANELQRHQNEEEERANELQSQLKQEDEERANEFQHQLNEKEERANELQRQQKAETERANELQHQQSEEEERANELQRQQKLAGEREKEQRAHKQQRKLSENERTCEEIQQRILEEKECSREQQRIHQQELVQQQSEQRQRDDEQLEEIESPERREFYHKPATQVPSVSTRNDYFRKTEANNPEIHSPSYTSDISERQKRKTKAQKQIKLINSNDRYSTGITSDNIGRKGTNNLMIYRPDTLPSKSTHTPELDGSDGPGENEHLDDKRKRKRHLKLINSNDRYVKGVVDDKIGKKGTTNPMVYRPYKIEKPVFNDIP